MTAASPHDYFLGLVDKVLGCAVVLPDEGPAPLERGVCAVIDVLDKTARSGAKVMAVGNGGSAAIASHLQTDLCHSLGIRSMVFEEGALLTCLSNDYGYTVAYERLVNLWAQAGDVLVAISSSGKSENILRAVGAAKSRGCTVITMSAFAGDNPLRGLGHINFYVPVMTFGEAELAHSMLAHYITDRAQGCVGKGGTR